VKFAFLHSLAALFASAKLEGPWGIAYAPTASTRAVPTIVFLHGMWPSPEESCATFARSASAFGILVCPRGNSLFDGGTMWTGTSAEAELAIRSALDAAVALVPHGLETEHDGTLIGYSNGAYFAEQVAYAQPGRWTGLILLSMKLELDPERLRTAGVRRVLLGAGEYDTVREAMQASADALVAAGIETHFVSLGAVAHQLPPDIDAIMCASIAWVRKRDQGLCRK
jgi:predicted esterase